MNEGTRTIILKDPIPNSGDDMIKLETEIALGLKNVLKQFWMEITNDYDMALTDVGDDYKKFAEPIETARLLDGLG